jgi:hypothetical protein
MAGLVVVLDAITRASHETLKTCDSLEPVAAQGISGDLERVKL